MIIILAVQARLGSKRLPGKVLKPLLGKPMLQHIMERLQGSKYVTESVIIAPMKDFTDIAAAVPGYKILADGKLKDSDLVGRYWRAAVSFGADIVVRVCADNPCVDIKNIDQLIKFYLDNSANDLLLRTNAGDYPDSKWPKSLGAEIYSYDMLRSLDEACPTPIREHPHMSYHVAGRVLEPKCPYAWKSTVGPMGFTVDTPEDFLKMEQVYNHFGDNKFTTQELLAYYV